LKIYNRKYNILVVISIKLHDQLMLIVEVTVNLLKKKKMTMRRWKNYQKKKKN